MPLNGGKILVRALQSLGARRVFAVPGESYLAALDALCDHPQIELVTCRQEGGAAMMAEASGKLTGLPGLCFVTRGPGATNAGAGVHIAQQDSTPMILFIGQVARGMAEREAFQEIDYRRFFSPITKWAAQIDDPARISEFINRAWHTAVNGRPGPVVLALPEDVLSGTAPEQPLPGFRPAASGCPAQASTQALEILEQSDRPVVLTGRAGWTSQASAALERFATTNHIPVAATFRSQDTFDNRHPNYIGDVGIGANPELAQTIRDADTLLVIGARLGEMTTSGYSLIDIPRPAQRLIHVYPGAEELNRTYAAELPVNCGVSEFCQQIAAAEFSNKPDASRLEQARDHYLEWNRPLGGDDTLQLSQIVAWLSDSLPEDSIITNGAGNYSSWVHRFFRYKKYHTQLAPTSGSMGYGLPAALAAKCQYPDRTVVCFAGDGCLQMTLQELATAMQFKLNITLILVNNNSWGTIRMHQERHYPGRVKGTDLANPDFPVLGSAYGMHTETVESTAQFKPAFTRALASGSPALVEIRHPLETITPTRTLSQFRKNG